MGHYFHNAKSAGIQWAKDLNKSKVEEGLNYAKARRKLLQKEALALRKIKMRTQHLKVIANGKGVKAKEILSKINGESRRTCGLRYADQ